MSESIPVLICGLTAETGGLMNRLSTAGLHVRPELAGVGETTALAFWSPQHMHRAPLWDFPEPLIEMLENNDNRKSALASKLLIDFDKQLAQTIRKGAAAAANVNQQGARFGTAQKNALIGTAQKNARIGAAQKNTRSRARTIRGLARYARNKAPRTVSRLKSLIDTVRIKALSRRLRGQPVVWQSAFDVYVMAALLEACPDIRIVYVRPSDKTAASKALAEDFAEKLTFLPDAALQPDGLVRFGDGQPLRQMHVFNLDGTGYAGPKPRFTLRCSTQLGALQLLDTYDHVAMYFLKQLGPSRSLILTSDDVANAPDEAAARVAALVSGAP